MVRNNGLGVLFLFLLTGAGHSDQTPNSDASLSHHINLFTSLTVGADFMRTNQAQTLALVLPFTNYYTGNTSYQSSGSLGITAGIESNKKNFLFWQFGLSGYVNTELTHQGQVWQFGLPEFNNFTYCYGLRASRIGATGKLLSTFKERVHPYFSGELGASFNRLSGYKETPLIAEAVAMAPLSNHTQSSFAWGVGVGVDADINTKLRLGLGYQFADFGKAQFGLSSTQETIQTLTIPHLYTHQIRFQLTALI